MPEIEKSYFFVLFNSKISLISKECAKESLREISIKFFHALKMDEFSLLDSVKFL